MAAAAKGPFASWGHETLAQVADRQDRVRNPVSERQAGLAGKRAQEARNRERDMPSIEELLK